MRTFGQRIRSHVEAELRSADEAEASGQTDKAFSYLERAHVLGQSSTVQHVKVHWRMFLWAVRNRSVRECAGQIFRIVGAATKTALGWVPAGNTGGANVSPFKAMPVPPDLGAKIQSANPG